VTDKERHDRYRQDRLLRELDEFNKKKEAAMKEAGLI
jgi:hypothetical protein